MRSYLRNHCSLAKDEDNISHLSDKLTLLSKAMSHQIMHLRQSQGELTLQEYGGFIYIQLQSTSFSLSLSQADC
jgi:hypothetical protein